MLGPETEKSSYGSPCSGTGTFEGGLSVPLCTVSELSAVPFFPNPARATPALEDFGVSLATKVILSTKEILGAEMIWQ